jgi:outer membrane protein OmpA-like peptidoglycan-associated protein
VLGDDTFRLRTPFEELLIRIDRSVGPRSPEQRSLARRAMSELRFGLEARDPSIVTTAQQIVAALDEDSASGRLGARQLGPSLADSSFETPLLRRLEDEFERGRLVVERDQIASLTERRDPFLPELPPLPPPPRESLTQTFEVRFVDEIGQAIGGLEVELKAGSAVANTSTNPAGVATLDDVDSMSGSVSVVDVEALRKILEPRWEKKRAGTAPRGLNTQVLLLTGGTIQGLSLKPAVPNTVVIKPPLGKLFVELLDKNERVRHVGQSYTISGPESFSGTTDEKGRLLHEEVTRGDYQLTLSLEIDLGNGETTTDTHTSPLVVLSPEAASPQLRRLGVVPHVAMARMRGMLFDTNKSFLLPTAIEALQRIRELYLNQNPTELLIVGHTDTTAQPDINDPLSLERADSLKAYLEDDVDTWLRNYDLSDKKKRWGSREDRLMITAMSGFDSRGESEDIIEWFQRTRELKVDGIAGQETRTQLITEYMGLDGIKLSEEPEFRVSITTHGAGENFPLKDTGFELDTQAADERQDPFDRRVELFFFDTEFGIVPAPGAPEGKEYLEWRKRSTDNNDFPIRGIGKKATVIEVQDALFRTNSCVVLPEGETPGSEHEAVTSGGLFATALRFAQEHRGKKLFIAGHTDTTATIEFNQTLSAERAKCALAILEGDRAGFVKLVHARHTVADYKQILSWCTAAFADIFNCDPGTIDGNAFTGIAPLKKFQADYNRNKATLGAESQPDLAVDGDIGPLTWGAIFDVYELGLRQELDEDEAGVAELRKALVFVDDKRKALGYGEHHPVDQVGRDNVRSQSNRRVELLFFDSGEEPDLVLAESDPDISELYLPAEFKHTTLVRPGSLAQGGPVLFLQMVKVDDTPRPALPYTLSIGADTRKGVTSEQGNLREILPLGTEEATLIVDKIGVVGTETYEIKFVDGVAIDTLADAAEVLQTLGIDTGEVSEDMTLELQLALGEFQDREGLDVTQDLDDPTRDGLTATV